MPPKRLLRFSLLLVVLLAGVAPPARADGFINPFLGFHFGGDSGCPSVNNCQNKRINAGVSVGTLGSVVGFEEDLGYAKNFFGDAPGFESSLLTLMSNLMIAPQIGPVRLYVLGGLGLIRTTASLTLVNVLVSDNNNVGYDLGGGLMIFVGSRVGVRGDIRAYKSLQDLTFLGFTLNNTKLNFGRVSVGLVFKF